jgi:hypothetical protein
LGEYTREYNSSAVPSRNVLFVNALLSKLTGAWDVRGQARADTADSGSGERRLGDREYQQHRQSALLAIGQTNAPTVCLGDLARQRQSQTGAIALG